MSDNEAASRLGPVTTLRSRYGGIYEPGAWLAFPCLPEDVPDGWRAGDVACAVFFAQHRGRIGGGPTPDAALADLMSLKAESSQAVPGSDHAWPG